MFCNLGEHDYITYIYTQVLYDEWVNMRLPHFRRIYIFLVKNGGIAHEGQ